MKTQLLRAGEEALDKAAELLKAGETVAVPTETVYGLAANALDTDAVARIFKAKGRPQDNPLILHISRLEMLNDITDSIGELALRLAEEFWPGPLTMIFPRKSRIPPETCGGLDTAAVRMPDNSFTLSLIDKCGFPIAAPSANTSGLPSPTKAAHVLSDMDGRIPLIVDGGDCGCGVESTVICFENGGARILRPGAVTAEMLSAYCDVTVDKGVLRQVSDGERVLSPGMKYKHYSPKADVFILSGTSAGISGFLGTHGGAGTAYLGFGDEEVPSGTLILPYGAAPETQAQNLFSSLRSADEAGIKTVYVREPAHIGMWLAVYNRLLRAAAFRVIQTF